MVTESDFCRMSRVSSVVRGLCWHCHPAAPAGTTLGPCWAAWPHPSASPAPGIGHGNRCRQNPEILPHPLGATGVSMQSSSPLAARLRLIFCNVPGAVPRSVPRTVLLPLRGVCWAGRPRVLRVCLCVLGVPAIHLLFLFTGHSSCVLRFPLVCWACLHTLPTPVAFGILFPCPGHCHCTLYCFPLQALELQPLMAARARLLLCSQTFLPSPLWG